jgi:pyruvate dehydrogenase E1 component beta subunit
LLPIGKAKVMKEGSDVTIVGYSRNVKFSLETAEILAKEGISCEVINLRTIKPLDRDTIVDSVRKTGRLVTVEDGFPQSGIGAEIIGVINETSAFDYLKGPVQRVTAIDIPMPYAKNLEDNVAPKADTITKAVRKIMNYK